MKTTSIKQIRERTEKKIPRSIHPPKQGLEERYL